MSDKSFDWLLSDDKTFTEGNKHITKQQDHYCRIDYNKDKLRKLYERFMEYDSLWKRFDSGDKRESL